MCCAEGTRVDLFANILASIGDQQTVEEVSSVLAYT